MSYTPTTWAAGDTVTATKLNNMETGIDNAANPFIVTCTPTSPDFSGTMDKTVAEIYAAYQAGKQIVFFSQDQNGGFIFPLASVGIDNTYTYPSFNTYLFYTNLNVLICSYTGITDDGTKSTYSTQIYSLTPAS